MVFIITAGQLLIPYIPAESADKAMVLMAARVVGNLGVGYAVLAAIFVAAPFAAVMSTVDSFLLMISSSIVRDIYQRSINPAVRQGALASSTGGLGLILILFLPTLWGSSRIYLFGLHPVIWDLLGSLALVIITSKLTGPPPEHLVRRYFLTR